MLVTSILLLSVSYFVTVVLCLQVHPLLVPKQLHTFTTRKNILNSHSCHSNDIDNALVTNRLDLSSRFTRWKILQDILDEEDIPTAQDINEILFLILKSFVEYPRPLTLPSGDTNPSPTLSSQQRELLLNELFQYREDGANEEIAIGYINAIPTDEAGNDSLDYENTKIVQVYNLLEKLHPDREEDEDAFKGCWDLVMELYGKEATRHSEQSGDRCWKMRSSVVRLLIHYDFLVDGLVEPI